MENFSATVGGLLGNLPTMSTAANRILTIIGPGISNGGLNASENERFLRFEYIP